MPLDPAAKNLLDLLVAAGRPKVWQVSPADEVAAEPLAPTLPWRGRVDAERMRGIGVG